QENPALGRFKQVKYISLTNVAIDGVPLVDASSESFRKFLIEQLAGTRGTIRTSTDSEHISWGNW
ncbi:MAG: hypothetical protein KF861_19620, partial [Planctomycetaceae bacterium]|nr:hypothetical protein [Planctomycetaceae bacterium]